jgi:hypothetical protein
LAALTPPDFHSTYYFHRKEVRFNEIKNLKTKDFETIAFQNGCISGSSKRRLVFYSKIHELLTLSEMRSPTLFGSNFLSKTSTHFATASKFLPT